MANPFDIFAADFKAAVPEVSNDKNKEGGDGKSINIMAQPAPAPVPVMAPPPAPMMGGPPPPATGGMMAPPAGPVAPNPYGAPPPAMGGGMMPLPPQQPPAAWGAPPPMAVPPSAQVAMVPSNTPSADPFSIMGMAAPPATAPAAPFGAYPPAATGPAPVPSQFSSNMSTGAASSVGMQSVPEQLNPMMMNPAGPPPPQQFAPPVPAAPVPPPEAPVPPPAAPAPVADDPFGGPPQYQTQPPMEVPGGGALVPSGAPPSDDPFGIFGSPAAAPPPNPEPTPADAASLAPAAAPLGQDQILAAADGGNPWGDMGFSAAPGTGESTPTPDMGSTTGAPTTDASEPTREGQSEGGLPPGGEYYDARIFTPTLGVMFFKPAELTDSLFLQTDKSLVDSLDDRPVVAFIVEGSSARSAGVELGHVLLKVNNIDVKNPKEASRLIKEGPRPLPLLFYVPDTNVVVAEGEHMVKYDTRDTGAPNSAKDWKPKYVVIGGIIAQPWMMNMYRSKSEYDIAVIETQARRPVSVKVKQFSLQGARIQNDWQGPQMVKYKNKLHPWKYIVVLPVQRNPIKISSPNLGQLKPVHEGVRRCLMAQQRHTPASSNALPQGAADPYAARSSAPPPAHQQYAEPHYQQHQQQPQQQQQQQYDGGNRQNYQY
mmetsp:Transcript_19202/g.27019  ORF Transcript_19202/g.27019 Transcript_19202/m.27019 type:complete len:654 (+) Transcript_19202:207-2168(+)|eukprot:CAMPEP_0184856602 /NCGR_PEP_ID=MMETSP0580-20130426/1778_1 /TAXON_ID=1118495 /ORGANISM="Dactyliosolen fragilissimus" /LENGTH=653 /DNA_ID=CAMNT_0027351709 /DNA_START=182 /DNA_END=2143 /DNA_ORIENTATION=+